MKVVISSNGLLIPQGLAWLPSSCWEGSGAAAVTQAGNWLFLSCTFLKKIKSVTLATANQPLCDNGVDTISYGRSASHNHCRADFVVMYAAQHDARVSEARCKAIRGQQQLYKHLVQ